MVICSILWLRGKREEKQIYFRSHIFLFSSPRKRCFAIMLKAVNRRTISLTYTFTFLRNLSSRARVRPPILMNPISYKSYTLKLLKLIISFLLYLIYFPRSLLGKKRQLFWCLIQYFVSISTKKLNVKRIIVNDGSTSFKVV